MNNKRNIWIVLVIIVIIGIVFLLGRDGTDENNNAPTLNDGLSSAVPAPGFTDVDEMIVSDEGNVVDSSDENGSMTEDGDSMEVSTPKIVTYTDSGFNPKAITIELGETVTFINNSSKGMWVASAVHPTHTLYPEKSDADCLGSTFDTCERISVGESWSFTFNKEGSWKYHDHVKAGRTGTIEVQ